MNLFRLSGLKAAKSVTSVALTADEQSSLARSSGFVGIVNSSDPIVIDSKSIQRATSGESICCLCIHSTLGPCIKLEALLLAMTNQDLPKQAFLFRNILLSR